jgi:RNA polymerase sigma-70 factor (ECF subfamily)
VGIPETPTFAEVLAAAQQGDRPALGQIWSTFQPRVLRYLEGRDPEHAEDVASEVWMAVADHLADFHGGRSEFAAWIFTIARNKSVDARRRRGRLAVEEPVEMADERSSDDDPSGLVVEGFDTDAALALVRRLPPDQADVVLLRVVAGLDMDRVAAMTGKSPGAVRVLQHRGLRRLAQLLDALPLGRACP